MMDRTDLQTLVQQFQDKFETPEDPNFWIDLVEEEIAEAEEAAAHLMKELCDVSYCLIALLNATKDGKTIEGKPEEERMHPLMERLHVMESLLDGYSDNNMDKAFLRVHASNMSKVNDDGQPERRDDGKILKGPNYKEPYLGDLIGR